MVNAVMNPFSFLKIRTILIDIVALAAIYLIPTISHLFSLPVYYMEPMRLMLIVAIFHTNERNAYLIAVTLPIFSLLISAHPSVFKTSLIIVELLLNVWLYFFLSQKFVNKAFNMFTSILISKTIYYLGKIFFVNLTLISGDIIATPIYMQVIMLFVFSGYIYLLELFRKDEK